MKRKIMAILIALTLLFALAACGAGEETTLSGMVVAVDGTVISFTETDDEMDFSQGNRPEMPEDFEGFASDLETTQYDLADAHISLEIDGGKESGSIDDIQPGSMVTLTVNGKGQVTYVLVSSRMSFGGGRFAN